MHPFCGASSGAVTVISAVAVASVGVVADVVFGTILVIIIIVVVRIRQIRRQRFAFVPQCSFFLGVFSSNSLVSSRSSSQLISQPSSYLLMGGLSSGEA